MYLVSISFGASFAYTHQINDYVAEFLVDRVIYIINCYHIIELMIDHHYRILSGYLLIVSITLHYYLT